MDNLNFQDIYAKLLDGKRLTLLFPSAESAESFRVKMSKYKTAQEELCAIVDIRVGSEGKVFSFKMIKNVNPVAEVHYKTSFEDKPKETYYEVIEIENQDDPLRLLATSDKEGGKVTFRLRQKFGIDEPKTAEEIQI